MRGDNLPAPLRQFAHRQALIFIRSGRRIEHRPVNRAQHNLKLCKVRFGITDFALKLALRLTGCGLRFFIFLAIGLGYLLFRGALAQDEVGIILNRARKFGCGPAIDKHQPVGR